MHITMMAIGSRGDVQPFVALGTAAPQPAAIGVGLRFPPGISGAGRSKSGSHCMIYGVRCN